MLAIEINSKVKSKLSDKISFGFIKIVAGVKRITANTTRSIATIPVNAKEATEFGILKKGEGGIIEAFIEKPKAELLSDWVSDTGEAMQTQGRNYLASMGIYIFGRQVLFDLLQEEVKDATDFGKEIIPASLARGDRLQSFLFDDYWEDIGTIRAFFDANLALTNPLPPFSFFDATAPIYTHMRFLPGSKVNGATVRQAIISDGCIISDANIDRAVIGLRSIKWHAFKIIFDIFQNIEV